MSIKLYSLAELNNIASASVKSSLPDLDPSVPGSFIGALVSSEAVLVYAAQRNIEAALNDFFPQTASGEFLDFWAEINGIARVQGSVAEGNITIAGDASVYSNIPIGTLFASSTGYTYVSTSASAVATVSGSISLSVSGTTITAVTPTVHGLVDSLAVAISGATDTAYNGTFSINVLDEYTFTYTVTTAPTAATDNGTYSVDIADIPIQSVGVGSSLNLDTGALVTLQSTVTGLDSGTQGTVNRDGITGGADVENDASLRERVLLANSIDRGIFTNAQIRLDALSVLTATRVFIVNPSVNYTTDGTDVVSRVADGLSEAGGTATIDMTSNGTANIYAGSTITVDGVTPTAYNGDWTVDTVTATAITYTIGATVANSTVHGTVSLDKLKNIPMPGIVYVFVLDDNNNPPSPSASTLANVKTAIIADDLPAHTAEGNVVVSSPYFVSVDVQISNLVPDTVGMRSAIEDNLQASFEDNAGFSESILVNKLISAIQNTQDLETKQYVESFTLDSPTSDTAVVGGSMGVLGTVTFA